MTNNSVFTSMSASVRSAIRPGLDKDPTAVAAMFDAVAQRYDLSNDLMSLGQDRLWRLATRRALEITPGEKILDLAAGTGTSTAEFAREGARVVACDFSLGMVTEGKRRHQAIDFVAGDATALPFADATFDAVTISFGLRNVCGTEKALQELARVTRPGGRLVICEFSRPTFTPFAALYRFYLGTVVQGLAKAVSSNNSAYAYLAESINNWHDQQTLGQIVSQHGWEQVAYRNLSGGIVALHRAIRSCPLK